MIERSQKLVRGIGIAFAGLLLATATGLFGAAYAHSTERESLLNRCWVGGVAKAGADEARPVRSVKSTNVAAPARNLVPFSPIQPDLRGSIRRVDLKPGSPKFIALTFDLCEQSGEIAGYDGAIIDCLRDQKIKATIFAGGKWMITHAERTQQLIAHPLFELGNHGWTHRNTRLLEASQLRDEIARPQAAYEEMRERLAARQCIKGQEPAMSAVPRRMGLYRFPYGACNVAALEAVAGAGLLAIQWDVSSGDPSPTQSAAAITANVLRHARPGSIVVFHANGRGVHTAEALPQLIPRLRSQGYQFVTVSELLAAGKPVITPACYDSRPGDSDKYDRLVAGGAARVIPSAGEKTDVRSTVPR